MALYNPKFKVGDRVRCIEGRAEGHEGTVVSLDRAGDPYVDIPGYNDSSIHCYAGYDRGRYYLAYSFCFEKVTPNKQEADMPTLKEKFVHLLTKEPMRTFRKLEITNGDNLLTDEGEALFLNWLFTKHQDEFKKDVADKMVEEDKKAKK